MMQVCIDEYSRRWKRGVKLGSERYVVLEIGYYSGEASGGKGGG